MTLVESGELYIGSVDNSISTISVPGAPMNLIAPVLGISTSCFASTYSLNRTFVLPEVPIFLSVR